MQQINELCSSSSENEDQLLISAFTNPTIQSFNHIPSVNVCIDERFQSDESYDEDFNDISTSSEEEDDPKEINCNEELDTIIALWAVRHNITHTALNDLLVSLSAFPQFSYLPKDSRTLLKTPITTPVKNIEDGIYYHFGIKKEIQHLITMNHVLPSTLFLSVGIDGLPIQKNPPSQMWPILGFFSNICSKKPNIFIIGVYYGQSKPKNCNEYILDFVNELCDLINNGFVYNNIHVYVELKSIICDTPAKSYLLNIKGHTGKKSCLRCCVKGEYENNRVCFTQIDSNLRSHHEFLSYSDSEFHIGETIITTIPKFDIVFSIPFDYMHCVCIGIMKKLLMFWTGVKRHASTLPNGIISALDERLNNLGKYVPHDFQRAPNKNNRKHPLRDASRWKASELRQVLLYSGMVLFNGIFSKEIYEHFLQLCVALRLLSLNNLSDEYRDYAKLLIQHFVMSFGQIYGKSYMSHNIHIILHLADDTKIFGSINNFSAFPYENFMQPLKKKIKTGAKPLQQLIRRYVEEKQLQLNKKPEFLESTGPFNAHCKLKIRPMTNDSCDPQYSGWKTDLFILKLNESDNCVQMKNQDIVKIENFTTSKFDSSILVVGRKYEKKEEFFTTPCSSSLLHIHKVSNLSHLQSWKLTEIKEKMMNLPLPNSSASIILPFLHLQ